MIKYSDISMNDKGIFSYNIPMRHKQYMINAL